MNLDEKLADKSWLKLTQGLHLKGVRNQKKKHQNSNGTNETGTVLIRPMCPLKKYEQTEKNHSTHTATRYPS